MARRLLVIGALRVAVIALVATQCSSHDSDARTDTTPANTNASVPTPPTQPFTTPPTTSTSTTTTIPATTTSTSSTTTMPPPTTERQNAGAFNGGAFDAVVAAATVDVGDISVGAAVLRDGNVLHTAALGMENPFESRTATVDTRFRIASVSKMFTAIAIMQLVDEGSIELDEPFAEQLDVDGPFTDPRIANITVWQLMSHVSGFGAAHAIFFSRGAENWRQAAQSALGEVLQSDPGTAFQYSNSNFCLLGLLMEKVTGQPFDAVIRQRVLDPLGIDAHLAPTFDTRRGDALHASSPGRNYMETLGPAGGWVATPLDVAKLAASLRDETSEGRLLDRAAVAAMRIRVPVPVEIPPPANGWSYGMGLMLFGDGSWGHTGTIESTHAVVVNRPDGLTVAILVSGKEPSNTDDLLPVIELAVAAAGAGS